MAKNPDGAVVLTFLPLTDERRPGDLVWWRTLGGDSFRGRLLEWDNGTAIVLREDGREVAA